jgi:hypothetical protein
MRSEDLPQHGTNARYNRGCKCLYCLTAHRTYMAAWRGSKQSPLMKQKERDRQQARTRAIRDLIEAHPEEFERRLSYHKAHPQADQEQGRTA